MKKQYINPSMEVVKIEARQLLTGSDPKLGGSYGGGTILSRRGRFDEDDEE
jgi:hypothetical protein